MEMEGMVREKGGMVGRKGGKRGGKWGREEGGGWMLVFVCVCGGKDRGRGDDMWVVGCGWWEKGV